MTVKRKRRTKGSGITKCKEIKLERCDAEGLAKALEEWHQHAGDVHERIRAWSIDVLVAASLPACYRVQYPASDPSAWEPMNTARHDPNKGYATLDGYVISVRQYADDSAEGYAARMMSCLYMKDTSEYHIYMLGYLHAECRMKGMWEAHALRGRKSCAGAREGHATAHGTHEQKQARWNEYQQTVNRIAKEKPHLNWMRIQEYAAKEHGVSPKTIQRHTRNPRTK